MNDFQEIVLENYNDNINKEDMNNEYGIDN